MDFKFLKQKINKELQEINIMQITKDTCEKSIVKTLSYRFSSSMLTAILIYLFTGQWKMSLFIGGIDFVVKLIWYYVHERVWNHVDWGELPEKKK